MSARNAHPGYPQERADRAQHEADDSDMEDEALAADYKEQVQYGGGEANDFGEGMGGSSQDLQGQLAAAAQPLEYQATLDTKIASYDSYCNLFHYILNSEGPVDLEMPSVGLYFCRRRRRRLHAVADSLAAILGVGSH